MQFIKRETLTTEITETGVRETTTKLALTEQDEYNQRVASLPEMQRGRRTAAESENKPNNPEDNEEFELLKKEEERVGQENREYAQEMQERDIAHQKVLTFRQHRDVADFEKGRKELLKREAAAAAAADVASVAKKEEERGADGGSKNFSTTPSAGTRVRGSAEGGEELRASSALTGDFLTNGGRSAVKAKVAFRKVGSVPSGEGSLVGSGDLGGTSPGQGSKRGAANLPGAREQRSRSRSPRREGSKKTTGLGGWGSDSDDD